MMLKIAFGTITTNVFYNINMTTEEFVTIAEDTVKNIFPVVDASIEIVPGRGCCNSELGEKIPKTNQRMVNYLRSTNIDIFYARIILLVENDEYIKTNRNEEIIYFKKTEITNNLQNTPILTEEQIRCLPVMRPVESESPLCGICYEREVIDIHHYQCLHVFCGTCTMSWPLSCALCRAHSD